MSERYVRGTEPQCPKCGSLNVGRTNECLGLWEWVCCMAGCRHTWDAPDPQLGVGSSPLVIESAKG